MSKNNIKRKITKLCIFLEEFISFLTKLNAKWRRILCYKKIQNIGVFCLAWFPIDIFRGLRDLIFDCNFKKELHFSLSVQTNESALLLPLDLPGFCLECDIFKLFENFQVFNEDRHAKRRNGTRLTVLRAHFTGTCACSIGGISVFESF